METNPGPAPGPSPPTPGVPWVNPVVVDWFQSNAVRVPVRSVYFHPFSYSSNSMILFLLTSATQASGRSGIFFHIGYHRLSNNKQRDDGILG